MTEGELVREVWGEEQYGPVECRHVGDVPICVPFGGLKGRPVWVAVSCVNPGCVRSVWFEGPAITATPIERLRALREKPTWAVIALAKWLEAPTWP